jgi:hypothetical protein
MARTDLPNDPVTFVPSKAFVLERQEQLVSGGSSVPVMVKVHPDPRVQRVLYQMREAPLLNAMAEVDDATDGNAEGVLMLSDKVVLPGREVSETNFGSRREPES